MNNDFQDRFDRSFRRIKEQNIALYGTGNNAQLILDVIEGYNFTCVVSNTNIGEMFCGKKIVSLDVAIKECSVIIIAAIPSSTNVVFNRIIDYVPENIKIYDMRGNHLTKSFYDKNPYWNKAERELYDIVDVHDVISFDLFDTLVQRNTLNINDLWKTIERKLMSLNIDIQFSSIRRDAEKIAKQIKIAPSLADIYSIIFCNYNIPKATLNTIREIEFLTDFESLQPRGVMIQLYQYARKKNKKVVITTDMYYSSSQISKILEKVGIYEELPIYLSCERNADKVNGEIFKQLKRDYESKKILHIGNDYQYDITNALNAGIDAYWVMGHYDLFCNSTINKLLEYKDDGSRYFLGHISALFFNNPFCLCKTRGKVIIDSYEKFAYIVLPITLCYMRYILKFAHEYDVLLFPSRDGYFLKKLYDMMVGKSNVAKSIYFYASRSAISSAATIEEKDIYIFCSKLWRNKNQNIKKFLENQFQISVNGMNEPLASMLEKHSINEIKKKIMDYKDDILKVSQTNRLKYKKYINDNGICQNSKIAVIDIVTYGTLIKGISNIIGENIDLIAMGTSMAPNEFITNNEMVNSLYGNINEEIDHLMLSNSKLSELHLILEVIYSSKDGQFLCFDDNNNPLFLEKSYYNHELLIKVQKLLYELVRKYNGSFWADKMDAFFALDFLDIIKGNQSYIIEEIKSKFIFNDPYEEENGECNILDKINGE